MAAIDERGDQPLFQRAGPLGAASAKASVRPDAQRTARHAQRSRRATASCSHSAYAGRAANQQVQELAHRQPEQDFVFDVQVGWDFVMSGAS